MFGHGVGDGVPAAIISVTAIAVFALSIPVIIAPFPSNFRAFGLVRLVHAGEIIPFGAGMEFLDKIDLGHV